MTLSKEVTKAMARLCDAYGYRVADDFATPQLSVDAFNSVTALSVANSASAVVLYSGHLEGTHKCKHYAAVTNFLHGARSASLTLLRKSEGKATFHDGRKKFEAIARVDNAIITTIRERIVKDRPTRDASFLKCFAAPDHEIEVSGDAICVYDEVGKTVRLAPDDVSIGFDFKVSGTLLRMVLDCFEAVGKIEAAGPESEIIVRGESCGYHAVALLMPMRID